MFWYFFSVLTFFFLRSLRSAVWSSHHHYLWLYHYHHYHFHCRCGCYCQLADLFLSTKKQTPEGDCQKEGGAHDSHYVRVKKQRRPEFKQKYNLPEEDFYPADSEDGADGM